MIKTVAPAAAVGVTLAESGFRTRYGTTVVAVKQADGEFNYATMETVLGAGDVIYVFGRTEGIERLAAEM
jgi:trk system potassium uptake protein TrkA